MSDFVADPKKQAEQYYIGIDFTEDLQEEIIDSVVVTDTDGITSPARLQNDDSIVYIWFQGGTIGRSYEVTVSITASDEAVYSKTLAIKVV